MGAPKIPWPTRHTSSDSSVRAVAQNIEVIANPATEPSISHRCPTAATSQPVIGVTTAVATTFRVTTQAIWSGVAESAPWSWGRATLMTVAVSAYSIVQVDTVTRISALWSPVSSAPARLSRVVVVIGAWEGREPAAG